MSILIRGMEMPTRCCECRLSTCYSFKERPLCDVLVEYMSYGEWEAKRLDNCPLIEVPSHGRLIDADALAKDYDGFPVRIDPWVWNELSHAPTIIPPEPCNDLAKPNNDADYPPSVPLKHVWTEVFGEEGET